MTSKIWIQLFVFVILISSICANLIFDRIQKSTNSSSYNIAIINTIKSCFLNETKYGIVIVGNAENIDIHLLMNYGPIIRIDNDKSVENKVDKMIYKAHVFIVTIEFNFKVNINLLKKSPWWNHNGFFIILDNGQSKSGKCSKNPGVILRTAWKMDILRAIFICTNSSNDQVIYYTLNPFTNRAPVPWKIAKRGNQESKDPSTLYRQKYNPKKLNCTILDYDKTLHLDGYDGITAGFNGIFKFKEHEELIRTLYEQLNATLSYKKIEGYVFSNAQGKATNDFGYLIENGTLDISLQYAPMVYLKNIESSEIIYQTGFTLISQDQGKKSISQQIYELFGWRLILIMIFFSAITIFMFKISMKMDIDLAILEIIRMWGNAGFLKKPTDLPSRIYLFGILLLALILCTVFQGKILGFQLNPNSNKNIDSMNDLLVKFKNYKIYGSELSINYLDKELIKRSIFVKSLDSCIEYVLNDSLSVCAHGQKLLTYQALKFPQLYLAKEPYVKLYGTLSMRKNWPLTKRVNQIFKKHFEHLPYKFMPVIIKKWNSTSDNPKPLKRQHFYFAFKFLGIGLVISFIIFIVEIYQNEETRLTIAYFIRNIKIKLGI